MKDLLLLGLVGVMTIVIVQNWRACMYTAVLYDRNGRPLPAGAPCNPPDTCPVRTVWSPNFGCLINPFQGGL